MEVLKQAVMFFSKEVATEWQFASSELENPCPAIHIGIPILTNSAEK